MRRGLWNVASLVAVACLVVAWTSVTQGEVPRKLNYQGLLTDHETGEPLTGKHELVFKLYAVEAGGSEIWSETDSLEADAQGVVSAVLGALQPMDIDFDGSLWLEVTVDGEVLSPRREVVSVPFALRAAAADNADSLGGFDAGAFANSAHNHDERYFTETEITAPGTVNAPGNPVDWTKLKGVPAGFADGRDSTGGVGDGHSLDAMDGDPIDALLVDDQGDVGIGLTNPQARLDVQNTSNANGTIAIRGVASTTGDGNGIAGVVGETGSAADFNPGAGVMGFAASPTGRSSGVMGVASGDQGTGVLGIADHTSGENYGVAGFCESPNGYAGYFAGARSYFSGRVGIGTETPQNRLHVHESSGMSTIQMTNTATGSGSSDGLHLAAAADGTGILMNRENKALDLGVNSVAAMRINASGKISIGGLDTLGTVTITGSTPGLILNSTAPAHPYGNIAFYRSGTEECGIGWSGTTHAMSMGFAGQRLYIDDHGHVGFNSAPFNPIDVTAPGTTWGGVNDYTEVVGHFRNTGGGHTAVSVDAAAGLDPILYLAAAGAAYWDLRTDSDLAKKFELRYHGLGMRNDIHVVVDTLGRVGIGTTDPGSYKLNVAGDAYTSGACDILGRAAIGTSDDHGYRLYVAGDAYATGTWGSSDLRLKDKIEPIDNALSKVVALRGVSFEWRLDEFPDRGLPEGRHYGVIAQEVEKVLPGAVKGGTDGEKAVAYNEIIPVLVEALKAQEARIQVLEREIQELRAASGGAR